MREVVKGSPQTGDQLVGYQIRLQVRKTIGHLLNQAEEYHLVHLNPKNQFRYNITFGNIFVHVVQFLVFE